MTQPLRAAAVDIGSNGIRFIVADAAGPDGFEIIHKERAAVRLGHHTFTEGHLDPAMADAAIEALKGFRKKADELGVHRIRAVATSAVREADDCKWFTRRARKKAGIRIDVIDGAEEARLVHRALRDRLPWSGKPWMFMDLGGGSLEIALVTRESIQWSESRHIGSVRLLERHADVEGAGLVDAIHKDVDGFQLLHSPEGLDIAGLAATGGNINELARMDGALPRKGDPAVLPLATLESLRRGLESLTVEQRMEAHGFRADRADVIVPAALVYERVACLAGADVIHVPGWGVREGVILDLMDLHFGHRGDEDADELRVEDSALALGRTLRFDEDHGQHVALLALSIFDQTTALHGLGKRHRRILHAAAMLHDVGRSIGEAGHHKHSQYIIEHADIAGLRPKDIQLAATVARYHRGALPMDHHHLYRMFGERRREKVRQLAGILRIADGLDCDRVQVVYNVTVESNDETIRVTVDGRGPLDHECTAAHEKRALLEAAFDRQIRIAQTTSIVSLDSGEPTY